MAATTGSTLAQTTSTDSMMTDDESNSPTMLSTALLTTNQVSEAPLLSTNIIITIAVWSAIFIFIVIFMSVYISCVRRRRTNKNATTKPKEINMNGAVPHHRRRRHGPKANPPPVPSKPKMPKHSHREALQRDMRYNTSQGIDNPVMMGSNHVGGTQTWYENHEAFSQLHQGNPTGQNHQEYPQPVIPFHQENPTDQSHMEYPASQFRPVNPVSQTHQFASQFHQGNNPTSQDQQGYPVSQHYPIDPTGQYQQDYSTSQNHLDNPSENQNEYPDEDYLEPFTPTERVI
ncbi:uncharacterized protein LOC144442284 [Glandiceps talaboti]